MSQPSIADLQNRILSLEAQLQRMQEQYPVRQGQAAPAQGRYGDFRTANDSIPPLAPEVAQPELREGEQAQTERRAAAASDMEIPGFDPYAYGEAKEGQSAAGRRQELVQIQKRRQAQKQAQQDQLVLNQSTMDIDSQPPDAQFKAAQAFADEHRARVVREQGGQPQTPPATPQGPLTPRSEPRTPQQPYRMPPPYVPQPDTSTQIPQPPDWRDTPERTSRGPTQSPGAQQQTFAQAQASFDTAVARQMQMLAGFVQDATRRVEELECWREEMNQG
jgi:hypothetical protein